MFTYVYVAASTKCQYSDCDHNDCDHSEVVTCMSMLYKRLLMLNQKSAVGKIEKYLCI